MTYGFMDIRVPKMVEMNFQMKSTQKTWLDAQFITGSYNFLGQGQFFPNATSITSVTRMAMKLYIIRKRIE
jgi:hypothetical protein